MTARRLLIGLALLVLAGAAAVYALNVRGEDPIREPAPAFAPNPAQVERGAYLARAGNCVACHTAAGGAPYAGGRPLETPFGMIYASNLTPDAKTGLGGWSADHFWRALHNGRSKDGRLLYPAFPYPNYTLVTREDSDALFAYLKSLPAVESPNRPHELGFPYNTQAALAVWRALFFEPGRFEPAPAESKEWNRGAYLVRGLGHCNACHASRNAFGATRGGLELSGGLIPMQNWYAPSLASAGEAGVAGWNVAHIVQLLKTGTAPQGSVLGPMAEVVFFSTQHLRDDDLQAMAVFLKALPQAKAQPLGEPATDRGLLARGEKTYTEHCAACHGAQGQGARVEGGIPAYPPLAGNRAVTMRSPANLVRVILEGGYLPATAGNPRPYGMPPFVQVLGDEEIADVLSYIRASWGNRAPAISAVEVLKIRQGRVGEAGD